MEHPKVILFIHTEQPQGICLQRTGTVPYPLQNPSYLLDLRDRPTFPPHGTGRWYTQEPVCLFYRSRIIFRQWLKACVFPYFSVSALLAVFRIPEHRIPCTGRAWCNPRSSGFPEREYEVWFPDAASF